MITVVRDLAQLAPAAHVVIARRKLSILESHQHFQILLYAAAKLALTWHARIMRSSGPPQAALLGAFAIARLGLLKRRYAPGKSLCATSHERATKFVISYVMMHRSMGIFFGEIQTTYQSNEGDAHNSIIKFPRNSICAPKWIIFTFIRSADSKSLSGPLEVRDLNTQTASMFGGLHI